METTFFPSDTQTVSTVKDYIENRDFVWDPKKVCVGVLCGGHSAEREVSLKSGEAVAAALKAGGLAVERIVIDRDFTVSDARKCGVDVFFPVTHGEFGEDGRLQLILDESGIPYVGSGPDASANAFDKVLAKRIFEQEGILTPAWMFLEKEEALHAGGIESFDFVPPVVIKPARNGSSFGITIARTVFDLPNAADKAFQFGDSILVERFVQGKELTVAVLGDEVLPPIELRVAGEFFDYHAKYLDDKTIYVCPAELPSEITAAAKALALSAHNALGCRDMSRADMILDQNNSLWVLEVNTLPGMTDHSLLPKAAAAVGYDFGVLCRKLTSFALRRAPRNAKQPVC